MKDDKVLTAQEADKLMTIADELEQLAETIRWHAVSGEWASQLWSANRKLTDLGRHLDQIIH